MYGEGRNLRYIAGFGLVIILLFIVIFMIVHGGGGGKGKVPETQKPLTSYMNDPDFSVTERIVGPVTAVQTHSEFDIEVTNMTTTASAAQGYDGNITASKNYAMTPTAFGEFLHALDRAGFTKGDTASDLKNDEGYCPTGQRYIFEAKDGSTVLERFWATSCGGTHSYKGSLSLTNRLFQLQVPDYGQLTNNSNFTTSSIGI